MSSRTLEIYFVTLNCGRALIDEQAFASKLFKPYQDQVNQALPDIVVLSLQEIAPLSYSFIGGRFLEPYFARILASVKHAAHQTSYHLVASNNAGMTAILVLAKHEIIEHISCVQKADVGLGLWQMSVKGAAAVRLEYSVDDAPAKIDMTFVAAHLAAHEMNFHDRNRDWEHIVRRLAFAPKDRASVAAYLNSASSESEAEPLLAPSVTSNEASSGIFTAQSMVFFGGDLNYRTSDHRPQKDSYRFFPQPTEHVKDKNHYSHLFQHDQLVREKHAKRTLHRLAEGQVNFPPTYKYDLDFYKNAPPQARGEDGEPSSWHWAAHRNPSWCDRILFSSHLAESIRLLAYTALPIQPTTDHRPVSLAMSLNLDTALQARKLHVGETEMPFPLSLEAQNMRSAARTLEVIVGWLAYVTTTWEGNGILLGTTIGVLSIWVITKSFVTV